MQSDSACIFLLKWILKKIRVDAKDMYSILSRLDEIDEKLMRLNGDDVTYRGRDKRVKVKMYTLNANAPTLEDIAEDNKEETKENFYKHLVFIILQHKKDNKMILFSQKKLKEWVNEDKGVYTNEENEFPKTFFDKLIAHIPELLNNSGFVTQTRKA